MFEVLWTILEEMQQSEVHVFAVLLLRTDWYGHFFSTGEEMRYSWDFFTDLLDNMTDLQMLKLKEKDCQCYTYEANGDFWAEKKHP